LIGYRSSSGTFQAGPPERRSGCFLSRWLNKALLKKVVVAVLIAAAETVVTSSVKGKGKPKQR
jgi:hypothetical protein